MELSWIGHACFRLRGRDATVITDPFARASGYSIRGATADVITVSNAHPNHSTVEDVGGTPMVLDGPGEYEVKGVFVTGVRTTPARTQSPAGHNTAYVVKVDEITVCHLGDLSSVLTTEQLELMKDVDVLLVPVGGHCTIAAPEAVEVISRVEPKLVVPMHYATEATNIDLEGVDRFLREMGLTESPAAQARLNITRSNLPNEPTVTLFSYRR
jgi:L-ascorbate metabolism protein UlaG (beta-lactamase superfamily)